MPMTMEVVVMDMVLVYGIVRIIWLRTTFLDM